uniref:Cytochrome b n=1 Tax=Ruditapes decussatus TaxID=104385 RepID=A0A219LUV7_9BIVA|nr:cytochrome b [Ruditapes decussatus]AJY78593.1 cytochrome b [Ruditapes decussatus]
MMGVSQVSNVLYDLPVPINLSKMWNFGSLLGLCLVIQLVTGLLLTTHYTASSADAFNSVVHIMRDVNDGWLLRACHANGASLFFIMVYLHMGRGVFYLSFYSRGAWWVGLILFCILMGVAFTGYVLPWGQMSFWGATVITNLVTAIPGIGDALVQWVWGGICVGDATLKRFFTFHFSFPFVLAGLAVVHIIFIHESGTSNPLGVESNGDMIPFHPYYTVKDLVGIVVTLTLFGLLVCLSPDLFLDPVNFCPADTLKTPLHIQPEWYFLFAYSILRSIPSKTGGIAALASAILVLFFMPLYPKSVFKNVQHNSISQVVFHFFVGNFMLLTFLGTCPVEEPYISVGLVASYVYFSFFIIYPFSWFYFEKKFYASPWGPKKPFRWHQSLCLMPGNPYMKDFHKMKGIILY